MDKIGTSDPADCNGENGNGATSNKHPETPKNFSLPSASSNNNPETPKNFSLPSESQPEGKCMGIRKNYKRAANRGRKGSQVLEGRNYSLRSPHSSGSVLHSISAEKKSSSESVRSLRQPASRGDRKGRTTKTNPDNEFSKIRKRVRYILNRMNYEQSLLEAYASEGWKNQSLEKIRPEKELERAKAEIVRCKLRIREAFQNLDSLLSKGKLEESLFDCEGEISCEDIFCATCGLKDSTLNNDIILCDGACDRGFHQNCLNPPLLTEDIPAGDEGWLCPACDCKIDCIDVINELHGTNLSINDPWENVFPEAAASAHGSMQNDEPDLPSDDSEDNDFDPNVVEEHHAGHDGSSEEDGDDGSSEEAGDEGSDSDDSNFVTSSDNSGHLKEKEKGDDLGLPSEDSEDDDYDPAGPDSDKDTPKKHSSLDESDFTSDSDDFCAEIAKSCGKDEVSSGYKTGDASNDLEGTTVRANTENSSFASKELEIDQDVVLPVSAKRQVQRLDYKKLHDEAYGEASSESSDSEEWSGKSSPEEDNGEQNGIDISERKSSKQTGVLHQSNELTPPKALQCSHPDAHHGSVSGQHSTELASNGSKSTAPKGPFGPIVYKRLHEHFREDQYPSRFVKEILAEELGMTSRQVSRWFETRRRYTRISASKNGMQATDPEEMMEKPNLCNNNVANDEVMSGNLNEGIRQGNAMEQGIDDVQKMLPTPLVTTSAKVGCPEDGSSRHAASPKDNSAEDQILGLRLAKEPRKKATQQEQKKRKMGR